jgi:hypothetical protein
LAAIRLSTTSDSHERLHRALETDILALKDELEADEQAQ